MRGVLDRVCCGNMVLLLDFAMSDLNKLLPLNVIEEDDGSMTIEWDPNDPRAIELGINDWTEDDWVAALEESVKNYASDETITETDDSAE